jgi:hypothetical protein
MLFDGTQRPHRIEDAKDLSRFGTLRIMLSVKAASCEIAQAIQCPLFMIVETIQVLNRCLTLEIKYDGQGGLEKVFAVNDARLDIIGRPRL